MRRHLTDGESIAVACDGVGDEAVASHLNSCPDCRRSVEEWKSFVGALRLPGVWGEEVTQQRSHRHRQLVAMIERMPADEFGRLADQPFASECMRPALEVAHNLLRRAPRDSLRLIEIIGKLLERSGLDLPEIAGETAKERANALRRLTRYQEAFESLDEAERAYRQLPAPFYELAFVEWGRATVYFAQKRFAEAAQRAAGARAVFVEHGDEVSAAEVRLLEGGIAFDVGSIQEARVFFVEAADILERYRERPALALAYQNLCTCDVRLGAMESAREFHARASALLLRFEMAAEATRLSWSVWEALAARGERDAALPYLRVAAESFRALGMDGDAAEVGLDILEQLIALERYAEAIPLAQEIAVLSRREGVAPDVANATAYLEQAVRSARATPTFVREMKVFVAARLRGESASINLQNVEGHVPKNQ